MPQTKISDSQVQLTLNIPDISESLAQDSTPGGVRDYFDTNAILKQVRISDSDMTPLNTETEFGVNGKKERVDVSEYWNFSMGLGSNPVGSFALDIGASGLLLATTPRTATTLTVPAGQVMALRTYSKTLLMEASVADTYTETVATVLSPVTPVDSVDGVYHVTTATWPYGLVAQHPYLKIAVIGYNVSTTSHFEVPPGPDPTVGTAIVSDVSSTLVLTRRSSLSASAFVLPTVGDITVDVPSAWEYRISNTPSSTTLSIHVPTNMTVTFNQPITFSTAGMQFADPMNITQAELDDCLLVIPLPSRTFRLLAA